MKKTMTQTEKILNHLRTIGPIDAMTALRKYGIMRLASRISEIDKNPETRIARRMKPVKCEDGTIAHVAEYWLRQQEEQPA